MSATSHTQPPHLHKVLVVHEAPGGITALAPSRHKREDLVVDGTAGQRSTVGRPRQVHHIPLGGMALEGGAAPPAGLPFVLAQVAAPCGGGGSIHRLPQQHLAGIAAGGQVRAWYRGACWRAAPGSGEP